MISVVMATYNGKEYIAKQLHSIVEQTVLPDEIIIADDRSTDGTYEAVKAIIEKHSKDYPSISVQLYMNEKNKGYIQNFLDAILVTRGDIVFLADQDDIWKKDKIEGMSRELQELDALALHSDIDIIDAKGKLLEEKWEKYRFKSRVDRKNQFLKKINYCGMSMAFDGPYMREQLIKILKAKIYIPSHDWLICALADIEGRFAQTGSVYTFRRVHGNNVALDKLNSSYTGENSERIKLLKMYLQHYKAYAEVVDVIASDNIGKRKQIEKAICLTEKRLHYISRNNTWKVLFLIRHIHYYPTWKAYLGDIVYALKLKKIVKKVKNNIVR